MRTARAVRRSTGFRLRKRSASFSTCSAPVCMSSLTRASARRQRISRVRSLSFDAKPSVALATSDHCYVLANPIDVLVVLVVGAQPLRLLRSARALRALRAVRVATMVGKGSKQSIAAVTRGRLVHGATIVIIATAAGGYAFAYFEGSPTNRFGDIADAFWWSAATITTLGPGIELAQTGSRIVALALTIVGLIVVAALAGTISAFFVETSPTAAVAQAPEPTTDREPQATDDDG